MSTMNTNLHQNHVGFIWNIANKLRGPYRPPQYRRVMLPLVVLRRLDLVLEATKDQVLAEYVRLSAKGMKDPAEYFEGNHRPATRSCLCLRTLP